MMNSKNLLEKIAVLEEKKPLLKSGVIKQLIAKEKYNDAFLVACKHCQSGDMQMLKLIRFLLNDKSIPQIAVDHQDVNTMTAIGYAAQNSNIDLFHLLVYAGAAVLSPLNSVNLEPPAEILARKVQVLKQDLAEKYKPEYKNGFNILNKIFANKQLLPEKISLKDEQENEKFDKHRLDFIIQCLQYLTKFQGSNAFNEWPGYFTAAHASLFQADHVKKCRKILELACQTIENLSPNLRIKYHKHFTPQPFTWVTFSKLGGLAKEPPLINQHAFPLGGLSFKEFKENSTLWDAADHFVKERNDRQQMIEAAIPTVIEKDMPTLLQFFKEIRDSTQNSASPPVSPVCLPVIKSLITYVSDHKSFENMVKLVSDTTYHAPLTLKYNNKMLSMNLSSQNKMDFSSLRDRHAVLRILQMIGELLTSKNFSRFIPKLDETVAWNDLIVIRDCLVHQDEGDNKHKVNEFLQHTDKFEHIVREEFSYFWKKLMYILVSREEKLGRYEYSPEEFWEKILKFHMENTEDKDNTATAVAPAYSRRISIQDEDIFITALKETKTDEATIQFCKDIFAGKEAIPNKTEQGRILSNLPSRSVDKIRYKSLANIFSNACNAKSLSEAERIKKRLDAQAEKLKREALEAAKFKGLDTIRSLARVFLKAPNSKHVLNPVKRIDTAIEAIENIKNFLKDAGYLQTNIPYESLEDWDQYHRLNKRNPLSKILEMNPMLNYAIEYNAGQALQHLDSIRSFKEAAKCPYIQEDYNNLRAFRNYLEHGDPLAEQGFSLEQLFPITDLRQQITAPMILNLIFKVLPELNRIKEYMSFKEFSNESHLFPLVGPEEAQEWEKAFTKGLKNNGFFNHGSNSTLQSSIEPEDGLSMYF
ncbi:ankyrin repeat domain-containing protein [Legionella septentrionalis]|uniref:ankyrin repeat domain-containing protein n=1 Tax=Legionella septentrionalis TaxID=2498109 RepID=UPI000F8E4495|nr:ankyrin repeat domain-containing protein [Legionella septentrionalis]RUR08662.1 ankyrin repeat protein [Legionella septentrionalis]